VSERTGIVTMMGNPVTLLGDEPKVGDRAPEFEVMDNHLKTVKFSTFENKITIIASVPSLDTPICDKETRRFNEIASELGPEVEIITISMDLPFAQERWCREARVDKLRTYSDHRDASFGMSYGVLIKELRLLARAVYVIDAKGVIRHVQLVHEIGEEPNYDEALKEIRKLLQVE